jgi:hypothetical protein
MIPNLTLIQLISEQTMPNLLPILRLKPAKLIHLVTPKTANRSANLMAAAHAAGIDPKIEVIQMSAMPGIPETFNAVSECLTEIGRASLSPVVNFTGGTKLMSIGAYAAALQQKAPSLYVDTQDSCFVDGNTSVRMSEFLDGDWSFTPIRTQLQIHIVAIANGIQRVTGGKPWRPMLPLATHLFVNQAEEQAGHEALHGPSGLLAHGREPRTPRDWMSLIDTPFKLPEPVATLAAKVGLVRPTGSGEVMLADESRKDLQFLSVTKVNDFNARYFKAIAPIQQAIGFLTGGWWEVIVAHAMSESGLVRDLRWSVQVGDRYGADVEEDIVALDGVELVHVSCKRGGAKARLLPQLEEIRARASTLGGTFNRRFLAVLNPPSGKVEANLRQRAKELGVRLVTRHSVYQPDAFAR